MKSTLQKLGIILIIFTVLTGCATLNAHYGTFVLDTAVEKNFEAFLMDSGMNYYYSGPDAWPNAIIGLKKELVLTNDLWKPIEPNRKVFKTLIEGMQEMAFQHGTSQRGFIMQNHRGNPLGVWYAILSIKTMVIKMGEGNEVNIFTPELAIYPGEGGSDPRPTRGR